MNTFLSRLRERPVLTSIAAVALVLAAGLAITAWTLGGSGDDDFGSEKVVNTAGGYQIMVPGDWKASQQGPTTTVTSPGKHAALTASTGNPGPLHEAGALFFQQVGRHYKDVKLTGVQGEKVGPRPALVYGGTGLNDKNVRVNFLAITIEAQPVNYAVSVFTAADSDAQQVLPRVNNIVDTFRTLQ
ncbi:MAG: hypothetical protein GEV09_05260 [Pseudonocardiaceae bacterium]|nr:hypothetical protein [Pseudonocardiaceae bacterium]